MKRAFEAFASAVTSRPKIALIVLAAVTAVLLFGATLLGPQAGNDAFLPNDSDVAASTDTLAEAFPDSAGLTSITILHRGDFLTPAGLSQIDRVIASSVGESTVADRLALTDPVVSVAGAFKQALGVDDISSASQEQIDAVAAQPEFAALLDSLSGEADGEALVIRWLERAAASSA